MTNFQYFAVVVIMLFTSFMLYPGRRRMDSSSTAIAMVYLGSFTANYGAQLWVTLVAGKLISLQDSEREIQCCFTSTETTGTVRDGEPRTSTSTFTQRLRSVNQGSFKGT